MHPVTHNRAFGPKQRINQIMQRALQSAFIWIIRSQHAAREPIFGVWRAFRSFFSARSRAFRRRRTLEVLKTERAPMILCAISGLVLVMRAEIVENMSYDIMLRVMREAPIPGGYNLIYLLVYMMYDITYINTPTLLGSSVVCCSEGNGWGCNGSHARCTRKIATRTS
jgi:hypothetical protein